MIQIINIRHILVCMVLCAWVTSGAQQTNPVAGRVVTSSGDVYAVEANNSSRRLIRRSVIYAGDTIETNDQSNVQLRMIDSAIVTLRCESSLKIEEYRHEQDQDDLVVLRLLMGGLRTITGSVGQQHSNRYRFFAGESQVEIMGTDFEVQLEDDGTIYFANYDGGITITNPHGSVKLGIGADADFAVVEPGEAPRVLYFQPQQLGSTSVSLSSFQQPYSGC